MAWTGRDAPAVRQPAMPCAAPPRPELIRDEVLSEIFLRERAGPSADHPALDGRRVARPAPRAPTRVLSYTEMAERAKPPRSRVGSAHRGIGPGDVVGLWMARGHRTCWWRRSASRSRGPPGSPSTPRPRPTGWGSASADAAGQGAAGLGRRCWPPQAPTRRPGPDRSPRSLDRERLPTPRRSPTRARAGLTPQHPAYLIYTSGSTGVPKGIVISHANICHFLRSGKRRLRREARTTSSSRAPRWRSTSPWRRSGCPYLVGATLFVASPRDDGRRGGASRDPGRARACTVIDTVPTLLAMISEDLPGIRLVLLGGEALPEPLVARWATAFAKAVQHLRADRGHRGRHRRRDAAGRARHHRRADPELFGLRRRRGARTCSAPGEQGELLIGGPGVAKGYLQAARS